MNVVLSHETRLQVRRRTWVEALSELLTYIFKVVHLQNLIAPVAHPEDLNAATRVNLHHAVRLDTIQNSFVLMVIHLQRHERPYS